MEAWCSLVVQKNFENVIGHYCTHQKLKIKDRTKISEVSLVLSFLSYNYHQ